MKLGVRRGPRRRHDPTSADPGVVLQAGHLDLSMFKSCPHVLSGCGRPRRCSN